MVEHKLEPELIGLASEERWPEVILIAVDLAPAAQETQLVSEFLASESDGAAELEMAGLCTAEDVQLDCNFRGEVRHRLVGRLNREEAAGPFHRLTRARDAAWTWMGQCSAERIPTK